MFRRFKLTIVLTIASRDGIVMAADRRITQIRNQTIQLIDEREKLIILNENRIAIAYWGLATLNGVRMSDHIGSIKNSMEENEEEINVDSIAERISNYFQQYDLPQPMGFHIAGYLNHRPKIRHVFHQNFHEPNEVTNEETNIEFHDIQGNRQPHTPTEDYVPYLSLFNGDNVIVQSLLLSLPGFFGQIYNVDLARFSLDETQKLVKLLSSITIYLPQFLRGYREVGRTCGNGLDVATITSDAINIERNVRSFRFDLH